jgi:hypothetical protein
VERRCVLDVEVIVGCGEEVCSRCGGKYVVW